MRNRRGEKRDVPKVHLASALTDFSLCPIQPEFT
jgi:hypothetical protein